MATSMVHPNVQTPRDKMNTSKSNIPMTQLDIYKRQLKNLMEERHKPNTSMIPEKYLMAFSDPDTRFNRVEINSGVLRNYTQSQTNQPVSIKLNDMQLFTARHIAHTPLLRSFLMFWDTGYGKTLTALYAIDQALEAYPRLRAILMVKASLIDEPWRKTMKTFFPWLVRKVDIIKYEMEDTVVSELKTRIQTFDKKIDRVMIVIDEAHKFVSRYRDTTKSPIIELISNYIFKYFSPTQYTSRLLLLTATPISNNIQEMTSINNLIRPQLSHETFEYTGDLLFNRSIFTLGLLGVCSCQMVDLGLATKPAKAKEHFPAKEIVYHDVPMSIHQSDHVLSALSLDRKLGTYNLKTFTRLVSNFIYEGIKSKQGLSDEDYKAMVQGKLNNFTNKPKTPEMLRKSSAKYWNICESILETPGKVLVYMAFVTYEGVNTFVEYLKFFNISYGVFSQDKLPLFEAFNHPDNDNGDNMKVFIITNKGVEGISFKSVNDMYIADIPWNNTNFRQIVGRAIRMNSHDRIDRKWVNIHIVRTWTTKDGATIIRAGDAKDASFSVESSILDFIHSKEKQIIDYYTILRETSIESIWQNTVSTSNDTNHRVILDIEEYKPKKNVTIRTDLILKECKVMLNGNILTLLYDPVTLHIYYNRNKIGRIQLSNFRIIDGNIVFNGIYD